ncbi:MAG: FMN-binding negative transcriptional regulator [Burkholderiales bacterium]|nr:FMN-binding negative transcriptional regulator [Burkholderiales bacterium]
MYVPNQFSETRVEVLHALIRAHPLAAIVTLTPDGLAANHVPVEIDPNPPPYGTLRGHVARANPMWRELVADVQALAIFQGPQSYISPSSYATKRETGKVAPTWNYAVVHARGALRAIDDRAWLRAHVERLTDRQEAGRSDPWKVAEAPPDYVEEMLNAIAGIEIPIAELTGKWKVSQNRPARDRDGVIAALTQEGTDAAAAMAYLVKAASSP